jgi:hypothetical protein
MSHFVKEESQNDRGRETKKQIIETNKESIPQQAEKIGGIKKTNEILYPYPGAPGKSPAWGKVLKGDQCPVHGLITKKSIKKNYR